MEKRTEYEWTGLDVIVELPEGVSPETFMERLIDTIVSEVEAVDGRIGGSLGRLVEWQEEADDG